MWPYLSFGIVHFVKVFLPHQGHLLGWIVSFLPSEGAYALPANLLYTVVVLLWLSHMKASVLPDVGSTSEQSLRCGLSQGTMMFFVGATAQLLLMRMSSVVLYQEADRIEVNDLDSYVSGFSEFASWGPRESFWAAKLLSGIDGANEELVLVALVMTVARSARFSWKSALIISLLFRWSIHLYYGPIHAFFRVALWGTFAALWFMKNRTVFPMWVAHFVANAFSGVAGWEDTPIHRIVSWWVESGELLVVSLGLVGLAIVLVRWSGVRDKSPMPPMLIPCAEAKWKKLVSRCAWGIGSFSVFVATFALGLGLHHHYRFGIPPALKRGQANVVNLSVGDSLCIGLSYGLMEVFLALLALWLISRLRYRPTRVMVLVIAIRFVSYIELGVAQAAFLASLWGTLAFVWIFLTGRFVPVAMAAFYSFASVGWSYATVAEEAPVLYWLKTQAEPWLFFVALSAILIGCLSGKVLEEPAPRAMCKGY